MAMNLRLSDAESETLRARAEQGAVRCRRSPAGIDYLTVEDLYEIATGLLDRWW
ncbi:MAG: hypothetical protein ACR2KP_17730 [Egibacteraceae bacterium]